MLPFTSSGCYHSGDNACNQKYNFTNHIIIVKEPNMETLCIILFMYMNHLSSEEF